MTTNALTLVTSDLKTSARKVALQAIENVHLAYYEKGGIRDNAQVLEMQLEGAAKHVFTIATYAARQHPDTRDATELYIAMCEFAEQSYKVQHGVDNLREALPTWASYKSNILRGLKLGLDPGASKSEKQFRSRTMEQVSRSKSLPLGARAGPMEALEAAIRPQTTAVGFVASTAMPEPLRPLLARIVAAAEIVKPGKVLEAEAILLSTLDGLNLLVDRRRVIGE